MPLIRLNPNDFSFKHRNKPTRNTIKIFSPSISMTTRNINSTRNVTSVVTKGDRTRNTITTTYVNIRGNLNRDNSIVRHSTRITIKIKISTRLIRPILTRPTRSESTIIKIHAKGARRPTIGNYRTRTTTIMKVMRTLSMIENMLLMRVNRIVNRTIIRRLSGNIMTSSNRSIKRFTQNSTNNRLINRDIATYFGTIRRVRIRLKFGMANMNIIFGDLTFQRRNDNEELHGATRNSNRNIRVNSIFILDREGNNEFVTTSTNNRYNRYTNGNNDLRG